MLGSSRGALLVMVALIFFRPAAADDPLPVTLSKETDCDDFVMLDDCDTASWEGVLRDLFSPDDTCPNSTRYIDFHDWELEISGSDTDLNCNSTWGRRYNETTTVNPTLEVVPGESPCVRTTSFASKVPEGDPLYAEAQAGALNFTLKLGMSVGSKVVMFNGVYDGQGGDINGVYVPPSDCDNFWLYLKA